MIPRPYQKRLVENAVRALAAHGNTLAVAATGAGKTIMLSQLAKELGGRQLILQHRQELVQQNLHKYKLVNPGVKCGLWTADVKSLRADCTFAMVQSLAGHVDKLPAFDLVIADEAHHCAAPTWRAIIDAARAANPAVRLAGFTATPLRSDRKNLRKIFSNVCDQITISEMVALGFLVPPRGFVVDVSGTQAALLALGPSSDFGEQVKVEEILNTSGINAEVIRHWREKAGDRQTIVFASTVHHAQDVASAFCSAGIAAACVHGGMADASRQAILKKFSRGELQVLTNVMVLTEGFDHPPVSCIILLRKCSDKGPLVQMVGRGLRIVHPAEHPGLIKKDCLVLDFGASLLTHGDLNVSVDLGREKDPAPGEAITKLCPDMGSDIYRFPDKNGQRGCGAELPAQTKHCPLCGFVFERLDAEASPGVTYLELAEMDLLNASPFRYCDLFGTDRILMASGFEAWAGIFSPDGETWFALGKERQGKVEVITVTSRLAAMAAADDYLRLHETDSTARKTKRWLDDPATDKQISLLNQFGYDLQADLLGNTDFTKYAAACHTNFQFARRDIEAALGVAS